MFIEETNRLLNPGYLSLETGYQRLSNGHFYLAVLTRMPGCAGKMVDWWFGYAGDTEKYKTWHPQDHIIGEWDDKWRPGCYIGASHLVHEYVGGDLVKLRITFREPSEFFDTARFAAAKVGAAVCGKIGLLEDGIQIGNLIHLVRDTDFGCEMRSRFWLFAADEKLSRALMQHCIEEMGNLADLLPALYYRETGGK